MPIWVGKPGIIVSIVVLTAGAAWPAEVTLESLLRDMTDLERLATFPKPAFTHRLFSSYDRRSTDPTVATDDNWFADLDGSGYLRMERDSSGKEHWVIMDAPGPGAIVRVFSSFPFNGRMVIRVYLDHNEQPVIELPLVDMLGGRAMPFIPPISQSQSNGWTSYFPIPYADHCKVTVTKPALEPIFYYHVNYLTYEPGTTVQTYSPSLADQYADLIAAVASRLADPAQPKLPDDAVIQPFQVVVEPGASEVLASTEGGAGAVYRFTCRPEALNLVETLRSCVLEISFDGHNPPQVLAPLGDFFGTVPGLHPFQSLPAGVLEDGTMYAHWVMPFQRSARILVRHHGSQAITLRGETVTAPFDWGPDTMYFHAKWRSERDIPTYPRRDWTFLECRGKGRYMGNMYYFMNPVYNETAWGWWGEGEEKVYVDGETFPSSWGTGTEDYYGFGWGSRELFSHAYFSMVTAGNGISGYGHNTFTRYHIPDSFPFQSSFKFDMEIWHWTPCNVAVAATSYWYASPGSEDFFKSPQSADLTIPVPPPPGTVGGCGAPGSFSYAVCALFLWAAGRRKARPCKRQNVVPIIAVERPGKDS